MNRTQLRHHLQQVHSSYRALVETDRLDELTQELTRQSWMPSTNGSSPSQVAIEVTHDIMTELHSAAAMQDKRGARGALDRLRRLIQLMASPGPEPLAR